MSNEKTPTHSTKVTINQLLTQKHKTNTLTTPQPLSKTRIVILKINLYHCIITHLQRLRHTSQNEYNSIYTIYVLLSCLLGRSKRGVGAKRRTGT